MSRQSHSKRKTFGQHPPPVSKLIKSILESYPEGQIFKELIQNADDAGAEVVRFYIDGRDHPPQFWPHSDTEMHQGPALIAANDAVFTDKDWEGIQRLQDSIKAEDPFNVGKFGIGFNAVYHITDVPSIISGETVAYLDPQERVWPRESGMIFSLSELQDTGALTSLEGIEGFSSSTINYSKTLFRFPLRNKPSPDLSLNTYTASSLLQRVNALRNEAKFLLLFLRSVHTIEVYSISSSDSKPHALHFQVQIAPESRGALSEKRTSFLSELRAKHTVSKYNISPTISYVSKFNVNITDIKSKQAMKSISWLVANQVGSSKRDVLDVAKMQHCFPWVGVAMELGDESLILCDATPLSCGTGRIFCFLPMPAETTSKLPVHVNGTFGLNDNRRTIKWPIGEMENDLTAQWNRTLVTECFPSCYNLLLKTAVAKKLICPKFYHNWPNKSRLLHTYTDWKLAIAPLLQLVFQWECLWAQELAKWVKISQSVVLYDTNTNLLEVVKRVLTKCGLQLCEVPEHVYNAIYTNQSHLVKQVSPSLVCQSLHSHSDAYSNECYDEQLKLLHYCLRDTNYSNLIGLKLLPVADKSFKTFTSSLSGKQYYVCSNDYPRKLLPNIDDKLVDLSSIYPDLHKKLQKVAHSSTINLEELSVPVVAKLLTKCYPGSWANKHTVKVARGDHGFPYEWWETFWAWVQIHVHDLSYFESQHVVPLVTNSELNEIYATKLTRNSDVVLITTSSSCSAALLDAFRCLQIQCVILEYFHNLRHWKLLNYLNQFNPVGVLNAIANSGCLIEQVTFTDAQAVQLQQFLTSKNIAYLSASHKIILTKLRIFNVLNRNSLMSIGTASDEAWISQAILEPKSFSFSKEMLPDNMAILSRDENRRELIEACESVAMPETMVRFLIDYLFQMVRCCSCPEDKIDTLMEHVLQNQFPILMFCPEFINQLKCLPFIRCDEYSFNTRKAPNDLYDSSDHLLKDIFLDMPVFPLAPFNKGELLHYLRQCDLKTTVPGQQLMEIIDKAASQYSDVPCSTSSQNMTQIKAVLSYVKKVPKVLDEEVYYNNRWMYSYYKLFEVLQSLSKNWLPVEATPPQNYPKHLSWSGKQYNSHFVAHSNHFTLLCTDSNIEHFALIVGSQMYFVNCPHVLCKKLHHTVPIIPKVFDHFFHIIDNHKLFSPSELDKLVHHIYEYLSDNLSYIRLYCSTNDLSCRKVIWVKKQHRFATPNDTVLRERSSFPYSLAPFYDILSESLHDYSNLFQLFGVRNEFSDKDIMSVLRKIKSDEGTVSSRVAWRIVEHVLNWVTDGGETLASEKLGDNYEMLVVPVQSDSERPRLVDIEEVVYTDLEFLRSFESEGDETQYIHEKFSHLAMPLGVKALSAHLNVSYDAFDDVGQHEPLITRLKNILKDYKDGLTIVKELLQNADDAGATELTICYDARQHSVNPKSLIYRGMAECHGPALLVHNNATFTTEDFDNITKLAGATKMNKPLKIGKFGVGFCSVYHITDVPSFVSGKWLYIFDPIIKYLKNEVKDRARPGKKLPFTERIVRISKQLIPYKGLFGFDENGPYQGTLFRFPFRTSGSEISSVVYDAKHIQELFCDLQKAGSKLLLFLSNLKRITFGHIDKESDGAMSTLYVVERSSISDVKSPLRYILPTNTKLMQIDKQHDTPEVWLVASEMDSNSDKPVIATVACSMQKTGLRYLPQQINGEMFCYLPLSLQTGLPVHVSANFAVLNDRTGIHVSDYFQTEEAEWNIQILQTVIPKAYFSLLLALKQLCIEGQISESEYEFFSLWPLKENLKSHNPWDKMIPSLYNQLTTSQLFYSSCSSQWLQLSNSYILDESVLLQHLSQENLPPDCVLKVFQELRDQYSLINIPPSYRKHFPTLQIYQRIVDEEHFLRIFFSSIRIISTEIRNKVLFITLRVFATKPDSYMKTLLVNNECVPCTPSGHVLKKCCDVIDPNADFSELYDKNDGVFPTDEFHNDSLVRKAFFDLDMIHDILPWQNVLERAATIQQLYNKDRLMSMKRAACVLRCIKRQVESTVFSVQAEIPIEFTEIDFLPVLKRPKRYPPQLPWFGDEYHLCSSQNLIRGEDTKMLAGSQMCVVSELPPKDGGCGPLSNSVTAALGIKLSPTCGSVVNHLFDIVRMYNVEDDEHKEKLKAWIEDACERIYKHFEQILSEGKISTNDLKSLREIKCIWTGKTFISSQTIARRWSRSGPYLYNIPHLLVSKENLITALGIRNDFMIADYLTALQEMYDSHSEKPITSDKELNAISEIANELAEKLSKEPELTRVCYLPDTSGIMWPTQNLAYNDAQWCEIDEDYHFVHHRITRPTALKLGIIPVRSKALQKYESIIQEWDGVPFGQREELTLRIQNILSEYPRDITVLKELLQNADDAGATRMYIILDERKHGNLRLPSSEWKDLQGPALLVWNDRGFSEKDLKGIQRLGLGSKRSNSETIGQYGIGFNVVYHLTDCPSFFTNGNTLCVLDPHCRYIPGANSLKPGRMYDRVGDKFWKNWSDMKSTYFRHCDPTLKCPPEICQDKGTLFRFPLRHSKELMEKSKIVGGDGPLLPLSFWRMKAEINEWAPKMKEALLFLNNVRELKFYIISDTPNSSMLLTHHFVAQLEQEAIDKRNTLFTQTADFSEYDSNQPFVIHYPLSLLEEKPKKGEEKWLIQQGVGDIQNPQQHWEYLARMKPQHGIAAQANKTDCIHNCKVFCFLPLPLESRLPIHVNGKFILDAARSGLWQSRDPTRPDDKHIWNHRLIEAIASSYVAFLVMCREQYISSKPYNTPTELKADIDSYYSLFPRWDIASKPEGEMLKLAEAVYIGLLSNNSPILAIIRKCQTETSGSHTKKRYHFLVEWLCLKDNSDPSKQAYFWKMNEETKALPPILKKIGMQLTVAHMFIREHLPKPSESEFAVPEATPKSVFKYYSNYYVQVGNHFPCPITESVFGSIENFITFVKYILQEIHLQDVGGTFHEFPSHPDDIPLLLTADERLYQFSATTKIICSEFANIFDHCGWTFLHPEMYKLKLIPSYFIEPSEDNWPLISSILKGTLPAALTVERVKNASSHISIKNVLSQLWKCFRKEKVFKTHIKAILQEWALIFSKQNELFSLKSSDMLIPVIPPHREKSDSLQYSISEYSTSDWTEEVFRIMENCKMPIVDITVVAASLCKDFCPSMDQHDKILQNFCHLHKNGELQSLSQDDSKIMTLFKYFKAIHFANDQVSLMRVKSLPLFKTIDGTHCSLSGEALIWPDCICSAGRDIWMKEIKSNQMITVVFLDCDGMWKVLGGATVLGIKKISPQSFYMRFIFPHFQLLNEHDRMKHLKHIHDTSELFNSAWHDSQAKDDSEQKREGTHFVDELKRLPCLMKAGQLRPISDFYNPHNSLFLTFLESQNFPPTTMRDSEWLDFLKKIGLKTKATKDEFLTFSRRVSNADCADVFKASKILLEYLFKEDEWHNDAKFLEEVSEIPFVCAENLKQLAWISRCSDVENIIQKGTKTFRLTSLSKATSFKVKNLVWTRKPVVILPNLSYHHLKLSRVQWAAKEEAFFQHLQVCIKPHCSDVIRNVIAVASSRFSDIKLFDTYSKECKGKEGLLFDVLVECFTYKRTVMKLTCLT